MLDARNFLNKGLVYDLPSSDYHGMKNSYSSSQLKDLLDDPAYFHKKHVLRTVEKEESPVFEVGTYFHTSILEPDKVQAECAVFKGIRRGEKWETFKKQNEGKAIITETELTQAENLIAAVKKSTIAMNRLEKGKPEVSAFIEVLIHGSDVYYETDELILGKYGWKSAQSIPKKGTRVVLKTRADLLADTFVLDLKSTTGNAKSNHSMRQTISRYNYDLSAALYLDVFTACDGLRRDEFVWTFASKDYGNSKSYTASQKNIQVGRAKYKKCLLALADGIESNWEEEDSMGILEPLPFELEHIEERAEDLL